MRNNTGARESVPAEVTGLLATAIDSMEQVELLLVLARDETKWWTTAEVNAALYGDEQWAVADLEALVRQGLVTRTDDDPPRFRYQPATSELRTAVSIMREIHDQRPMTLIRAVHARPSRALRSFLDAFVFRDREE